METKICPNCGNEFSTWKKSCSKFCAMRIRWNLTREDMLRAVTPNVKKAGVVASSVTLGSHGFGSNRQGLIDHSCAKSYRLIAPGGSVFEVKNLSEWCRKHIDRFMPDDRPKSKMDLCSRAIAGLSFVACGKTPSWKCWTVELVEDKNDIKCV